LKAPAGILLSATLFGCAATLPPSELVDARKVLQHARRSDTGQQSLVDLYEADKALNLAEAHFADAPSSEITRITAYLAHRRALWAMSRVNEKKAQAERAAGEQELKRMTQAEIAQSQQQVASTNEHLVLTLSASDLFAAGKVTLLPAAQQALSDIARTVKNDPRRLAVLGRADANGNTESSMQITRARVEAVRAFLMANGVPEGRVSASSTGQPATPNWINSANANDPSIDIVIGDKLGAEEGVRAP
jgi:outer membrane protein OmpA-like peptidoglycan-associated protein